MNTHFKSFLTSADEQEWLLTHDHFQVITYVAETDETNVRINEAYEGKDVYQPFTITQKTGTIHMYINHYFSYSLDNGATWVDTASTGFDLQAGDSLQLKATLTERQAGWRGDTYDIYIEGDDNNTFEISGNLSSLIDKDYYYKCDCHDKNGLTYDYLFYQMFKGNRGLVSAENLILPYNTTEGIYAEMFQYCYHLQKAPSHLPAKEISNHAYEFMFWTCSYGEGGVVDGLTNIPLVKTHCTTGEGAYHCAFGNNELVTSLPQGMDLGTPSDARQVFANTRITKAPKINIIGSNEGHRLMFSYCFALTDASDVHIENRDGMWNNPFYDAFEQCSLLDHFEIYGESWPDFDSSTFAGCAENGTFTVPAVTNYDPNDYIGNGIPSGWTIVRAS